MGRLLRSRDTTAAKRRELIKRSYASTTADDADIDSGSESADTAVDEDEYRLRRERNNISVRKSREKSRMRALNTADRVSELRRENSELETRVNALSQELKLLRELLMTKAAGELKSVSSSFVPTTSSSCSGGGNAAMVTISTTPALMLNDHNYFSTKPAS